MKKEENDFFKGEVGEQWFYPYEKNKGFNPNNKIQKKNIKIGKVTDYFPLPKNYKPYLGKNKVDNEVEYYYGDITSNDDELTC